MFTFTRFFCNVVIAIYSKLGIDIETCISVCSSTRASFFVLFLSASSNVFNVFQAKSFPFISFSVEAIDIPFTLHYSRRGHRKSVPLFPSV